MDPTYVIQYTIYSKLLQEIQPDKLPIHLLITCAAIYYIFKYTHIQRLFDKWIDNLTTLYDNSEECSILLPYHIKCYSYSTTNKQIKTIYSERFLAINHYIKKNIKEIDSLVELLRFENTQYTHDMTSDFVLLPLHSKELMICKEKNIYVKMIIDSHIDENDKNPPVNKYTYKLFTPFLSYVNMDLCKKEQNGLGVLNQFLEKCVEDYLKEINGQKEQMMYEFERTKKDDDEKLTLVFKECPFKSNKTFDNIFFEKKDEVLRDIREFSKSLSIEEKEKIEAKYKYLGIPFKRTYLLHGPPGCGKSSLIKAMANETGRHFILVEWSRIKTSADFSNLCADIKIQYKKLAQKDVILVFEDFDANRSNAVKTRFKNTAKKIEPETKDKPENDKPENDKPENENIKSIIENILQSTTIINKPEDELTLECVLNTLDGIREMNDAVIIFTTNVLDSIDPALTRPGRVDKIIYMSYMTPPIIKQMLDHRYKCNIPLEELNGCRENITPAELQEICNTNEKTECIQKIRQ